jgi:hypothetical protein
MSSGLIFIRNSGRKSKILCVLATVLLLVFVNSVHAETWTLWAKTQLFGFDSGGKKTRIDWFSNPAAETKESSSFSNQANCEAQRKSILQKFRDVQGKIEMPDDKRTVTIKVDGEIISMITEFHDGKGNSHQNIELLCRNDV